MKKRNYVKENAWQKEKYTLVKAHIDKQLGLELKEKLKNNNKTIASFITDNAKKYLNKQ
jgi:hypothetical protein